MVFLFRSTVFGTDGVTDTNHRILTLKLHFGECGYVTSGFAGWMETGE